MGRNLLVLDLDETLIHAKENPFAGAEIFTGEFHISVRPGLEAFLRRVSAHYDLMVWSNNGLPYINDVLTHAWPDASLALIDIFTSHECARLARDGMSTPHFKTIKSVVKRHPQYSIDRILAIDDKPEVYARNYGNLVAVSPFRGSPDNELELLGLYLNTIAGAESLRAIEKRGWRSTATRMLREQPELESVNA